MNKQTTALQLHIKDLEQALVITKELDGGPAISALESAIENAKHYLPNEKQQIIYANAQGYHDALTKQQGQEVEFESAEDYYTKTFITQ